MGSSRNISGDVYVLDFWGGFRDGWRHRTATTPPQSVVFRIVGSGVTPEGLRPLTDEDIVEPLAPGIVIYDLIGVNDCGVYQYCERGIRTRRGREVIGDGES